MRPIGFSTGALAYSDFRRGLEIVRENHLPAVELSALREPELEPLASALPQLPLADFGYISIHAPSRISSDAEGAVAATLKRIALEHQWPIIVHPDAIRDQGLWCGFGSYLCIENMDKRKSTGRTPDELSAWFEAFPDATWCLDLGHTRQCDPTMTEAYFLLKDFSDRLVQVHISDVGSGSKHDRLSWGSINAFGRIATLIPESVPIILESTGVADDVQAEVRRARQALTAAADEPRPEATRAAGVHA